MNDLNKSAAITIFSEEGYAIKYYPTLAELNTSAIDKNYLIVNIKTQKVEAHTATLPGAKIILKSILETIKEMETVSSSKEEKEPKVTFN